MGHCRGAGGGDGMEGSAGGAAGASQAGGGGSSGDADTEKAVKVPRDTRYFLHDNRDEEGPEGRTGEAEEHIGEAPTSASVTAAEPRAEGRRGRAWEADGRDRQQKELRADTDGPWGHDMFFELYGGQEKAPGHAARSAPTWRRGARKSTKESWNEVVERASTSEWGSATWETDGDHESAGWRSVSEWGSTAWDDAEWTAAASWEGDGDRAAGERPSSCATGAAALSREEDFIAAGHGGAHSWKQGWGSSWGGSGNAGSGGFQGRDTWTMKTSVRNSLAGAGEGTKRGGQQRMPTKYTQMAF